MKRTAGRRSQRMGKKADQPCPLDSKHSPLSVPVHFKINGTHKEQRNWGDREAATYLAGPRVRSMAHTSCWVEKDHMGALWCVAACLFAYSWGFGVVVAATAMDPVGLSLVQTRLNQTRLNSVWDCPWKSSRCQMQQLGNQQIHGTWELITSILYHQFITGPL